jgi:hypothetical protein
MFDHNIVNMVKSQNKLFPSELNNNIINNNSFPLNQKRLDRILEGYYKGLPPIRVEEVIEKELFIVFNGRHRIAATIIQEDSVIPVIIVKDNKIKNS